MTTLAHLVNTVGTTALTGAAFLPRTGTSAFKLLGYLGIFLIALIVGFTLYTKWRRTRSRR